jgi:hypothetical protein
MLQPQDRLMGLGLPDGGHLTHGYYVRMLISFLILILDIRVPPVCKLYFSVLNSGCYVRVY